MKSKQKKNDLKMMDEGGVSSEIMDSLVPLGSSIHLDPCLGFVTYMKILFE